MNATDLNDLPIDINAIIRKLSMQVADLVAEKVVLEVQNETLLRRINELTQQSMREEE